VASVQTLAARDTIRPEANLLVWDECHHAAEAAEEWIRILEAYPNVPMLGLTATPERGDGTGLSPIFNGIVQKISARQLIALGFLVHCEVERPSFWLKSKRQSGNPLAMDPVEAWNKYCGDRQGFMFCASVEEAESYASRLPSAAAISATTPPDIRASALERFRSGYLKTLCNVFVFTEGTDLPMASACVLARGASTAGACLQMVGRVLRPYKGKKDSLLVDLQGITHVWGMPEDERVWRLEGKACAVVGQHCAVCKEPIEEYPCPNCGYMPEEEGRGPSITEILNERLERFERKIAEGPEQRAETVRRWMAECAHRDHAPASVRKRFQRAYNIELTANEYFRALGDLTHDMNTQVADWAKKHLRRIADNRKAKRAQA
jgi:superfamily II DNA or RNA helicase